MAFVSGLPYEFYTTRWSKKQQTTETLDQRQQMKLLLSRRQEYYSTGFSFHLTAVDQSPGGLLGDNTSPSGRQVLRLLVSRAYLSWLTVLIQSERKAYLGKI